MNFEAYWQTEFPECPAIPHLLRDAYPKRWVRFHSLPESKRYAESEAEYQVILHRHNAVLDHLAKRDTPLLLVSTEFGDTATPTRADSPLVHLDSTARSVWTFKAEPDNADDCYRYLYMSEWQWQPGVFDPVLRLVADWQVVDTMIVCAEGNWICHPYDGGADFILPSEHQRDRVKSLFSGWLSTHPLGL